MSLQRTAAKQECDRLWSAIRKVQLQIQNAVLDSTHQHWCTGMIEARHRKKVAMLEDDLQRLLKHQEVHAISPGNSPAHLITPSIDPCKALLEPPVKMDCFL